MLGDSPWIYGSVNDPLVLKRVCCRFLSSVFFWISRLLGPQYYYVGLFLICQYQSEIPFQLQDIKRKLNNFNLKDFAYISSSTQLASQIFYGHEKRSWWEDSQLKAIVCHSLLQCFLPRELLPLLLKQASSLSVLAFQSP